VEAGEPFKIQGRVHFLLFFNVTGNGEQKDMKTLNLYIFVFKLLAFSHTSKVLYCIHSTSPLNIVNI
jgi:hypothetical protein